MKVSIRYKQTLHVIEQCDKSSTISFLKQQLEKITRIPVLQQELSYTQNNKKKVISDNMMPLWAADLPEGVELNVKNLGKQIQWKYVFYIQYFGPIIIMPLLYLLGQKSKYTEIQTLALVISLLHYAKRQIQTAYVHVFSRDSMPFKRVLINCLHYWILFALFNGIQLYLFPNGHNYQKWLIISLMTCWSIFQFLNLQCHLTLSALRTTTKKDDSAVYQNASKRRGIPDGWGFGLVSCANYFWEALGWITFSLLTRTYSSYLFTAFSIYQMLVWALKKHEILKKQFAQKYPKTRKAMFPFII